MQNWINKKIFDKKKVGFRKLYNYDGFIVYPTFPLHVLSFFLSLFIKKKRYSVSDIIQQSVSLTGGRRDGQDYNVKSK